MDLRDFGGRAALLFWETIRRCRSLALTHLGEEHGRVLLADAVRDDRPIERLLLAKYCRTTLVLAPRAYDGHERLLTLPVSRRRRFATMGTFPQRSRVTSPAGLSGKRLRQRVAGGIHWPL